MNTSFLKSAAILLVSLVALSNVRAQAALKVGDTAPDLAQFKFDGDLPELKGHVLLIDFWASWCAPCKKSFPVMKELHDKFSARGLTIIAISVDEKKSEMERFLKKNAAPFTIVRDGAGKAPDAFAAEKMPTSFIVGADGKILAIHAGFDGDATYKEYLKEIETALKAAGK